MSVFILNVSSLKVCYQKPALEVGFHLVETRSSQRCVTQNLQESPVYFKNLYKLDFGIVYVDLFLFIYFMELGSREYKFLVFHQTRNPRLTNVTERLPHSQPCAHHSRAQSLTLFYVLTIWNVPPFVYLNKISENKNLFMLHSTIHL